MEQLGLKSGPTWDASFVGGGLTCTDPMHVSYKITEEQLFVAVGDLADPRMGCVSGEGLDVAEILLVFTL